MKLGKLVKTAVKLAPVVYPVIRKILAEKKGNKTTMTRK